MARFLTVLQPTAPIGAAALINGLEPVLEALHAEVDHRTTAHLSALLRGGREQLRMQLFADVQAKAEGPVLELVLMSREPMGQGAPQTKAVFQQLLDETARSLAHLQPCFRSDRDGALPS
ncbi:MAG: hypothetical protein FJ056_01770 [Cyanobacteria bacterium M_surface_10_m2_179]|nr:hypothetical protein [Cyanobacteria bacterium M_surface_10_m2_179]